MHHLYVCDVVVYLIYHGQGVSRETIFYNLHNSVQGVRGKPKPILAWISETVQIFYQMSKVSPSNFG